MKIYLKGVAVQATAILLAGLGAAAIAFFQSVAAQTGACPSPAMGPGSVGALGAAIKGVHSAFIMKIASTHV